jgi:HlyD family secretion protein
MKRALIVLLLVAAIGAGAGAYYKLRSAPEIQVQTATLSRGDIVDTVGATGTLQAVTTVQVGSQVSGNISFLGADFNSIVRKGQVIAKLDPSLFEAQLQQAKANLSQAQANLNKAQSDLEQRKVALTDANQKFTRAKELSTRSLLPQSDLDAAKIAVDTAQAALSSQEATLKQSQAQVTMNQASVNQNQVNLDHTIIEAPIDGIVTQRSVDVGQTVAASMQAPTLFIIAADLTKMQVNANIDEADVGRIRPGQRATFRVDAYPTDTFVGTVSQIRLQPVVVQNVTTYGTIIDVPNNDLKLKPGMTANLKVEISSRSNIVRVPNAALRFRPSTDLFAALNEAVPPEAQQFGGRGGRRGQGANGASGATGATGATGASGATSAPSPTAAQPASPERGSAQAGGGAQAGGRGGDPAQMMDRFKAMSPEDQRQFITRMKDRGRDTSEFENVMSASGASGAKGASTVLKPKYGAPVTQQGAQTIDALFAPLPSVESRGRAWLYVDKQLKPLNLRLGITDGTNTEVLSSEAQPGMDVVIGVTGLGSTRNTGGQQGSGNPLMPQRGGPPGRGR